MSVFVLALLRAAHLVGLGPASERELCLSFAKKTIQANSSKCENLSRVCAQSTSGSRCITVAEAVVLCSLGGGRREAKFSSRAGGREILAGNC